MDNIIQIERLRCAKIFGERRVEINFHDLTNNQPGESGNLKSQAHCVPFFSADFFQQQPLKINLKSSCSQVSQNSVENTRDAKRLQYRRFFVNIEKLLRVPYFEKDLRTTAFVYLSCFIYYHFPNSYRIITPCSALVTTCIFCVISVDNKT